MPDNNYFLKMDGVPGTSTHAQHKDEMQLSSFALGGHSSRGSGRGRLSECACEKATDKASAKLMELCASGKRIAKAILTMERNDQAKNVVMIFTFEDLIIMNVDISGDPPRDSFSFAFDKVETQAIAHADDDYGP